jgi:hypothetical protein
MKIFEWTGAVIIGLFLGATPFLRYGIGGAHSHGAAPHSDHDPRHGGQVLMLGDHHVELVDRDGAIQLYLSDASRRPIRPAWASVSFDGGPEIPLLWRGYRSFVRKPPDSHTGLYRLSVGDGSPLVLKWP